MVFYAQSRGVPRETAVRLIVEGFFANVYDRITLEPVRETLRQAVAAKLELRGVAVELVPAREVKRAFAASLGTTSNTEPA